MATTTTTPANLTYSIAVAIRDQTLATLVATKAARRAVWAWYTIQTNTPAAQRLIGVQSMGELRLALLRAEGAPC